MSDGGGGGSQTASKEPWSEAAPWLRQNLQTGQDLQRYYQQNPFNQQQQTSYQNLFSDLDNFRSNMAPGLMQFANNAMSSGYQRPQYSKPGMAGYGQGAQSSQPAGLLSNAAQQQNNFSVAPARSYGLLDFQQSNPFTSTNGIQAMPKAASGEKTIQQLVQEELDRRSAGQVDPYYAGGA